MCYIVLLLAAVAILAVLPAIASVSKRYAEWFEDRL